MAQYLQPDLLARAEALGLRARAIVEGLHVGAHKSPYRGFSVDFVQHREYAPGDDMRHLDWKVLGRSERYTIKQYEQDTNFVGHILLDASKSMQYGDGDANKLEYAKLLAATLAYLILHQRDGVSLNIFDAAWRWRSPPRSQPGHMQTILSALESTEPRAKTVIGPLLHELAETARRRGLVFLISDCFDEVDSLLDGLRHLRFQGHEVTVFQVLHADELGFPFGGTVRFDGMEEPQQLLAQPALIRRAYLKAFQTYLKALHTGCEAHCCAYVLMNTARPLAETLLEHLNQRLRTRKT
jgi:uncharacterized protein (DUF58 family)